MIPFILSGPASTIDDSPTERLAELVHHLGDVSLTEARRVVHHNDLANRLDAPLAVVAGALVQLRHEDRQRRTTLPAHA